MKAQRRHELQQNVLGLELSRLGEFLKKRGTYLAWGALIIALGVMVFVYYRNQERQTKDRDQQEYDEIVAALSRGGWSEDAIERFKALSRQKKVPIVAANACLQLGDYYAQQHLVAGGKATAAEMAAFADQAAMYYKQSIAEHSDWPSCVAKAHIGLGKIAEDAGNYDEAKREYQIVTGMGGLKGDPVVSQAEEAIAELPAHTQPVPMASTAPATQPASQPATAKAGK